jgi:drug/metabolite transporter (DMT)-like permease
MATGSRPSTAAVAAVYAFLVLIWGTTWLAIRVGLAHYPPFFSLAARFCLAGPLLLLVMKIRGDPIPWRPRHQPFFLTLALLGFVTSYGLVYWCEQYVTSGLAAVIFALLPIFTAVVSRSVLHQEKLDAARWAGLAAGLAGIVVINSGDLAPMHPRAPLAALLLVLGPLATAFSTVLSKRRMPEFPSLAFAALPITYAGIIHLALWRLLEAGRPLPWSWAGAGSIAYLVVFGSILSFGGYFWLLARIEVNRANLIAYLTPLIALAVGFLFGGEALQLRTLVGAGLVLGGVALATRVRR